MLPTDRRKGFNVTHSGLFLFECYPQKVICLSVTHKKFLLFQGYPQKLEFWKLKGTEPPTDFFFVLMPPTEKRFVSKLPTENRNC